MTNEEKKAGAMKKGRKQSWAFDKFGAHLYGDRNQAVILAAQMARQLGYRVGVREDEDGRPVLYIDLPTGQVSWHLQHERIERVLCMFPRYKGEWDGHSRHRRWKRIAAYLSRPLIVKAKTIGLKFLYLLNA